MVRIKEIDQPVYQLYFNDKYIGEIDNLLSWLDLCAQIKEQGETGYKIYFNRLPIRIDKNGTCQDYPKGCFDDILSDLLMRKI